MLRALIFDFDGLIVDTESSSLSAVREAYRRHGRDLPPEQWRLCVGSAVDPYDHLQQLVGPDVDLTTLREEMDARHRAEAAQLGARPGLVELVADAVTAGLRLAVASSSSRRWVEGHLERIGVLQELHAVRCRDDVRQTKPAPDVYLAALDGLGVSASEAVAFEELPERRAGFQGGRNLYGRRPERRHPRLAVRPCRPGDRLSTRGHRPGRGRLARILRRRTQRSEVLRRKVMERGDGALCG